MKFGSIPTKSLLFRLSSSSTAHTPRRSIAVLLTNFQSSTFSTTTGSGSGSGSGSSHSSSRRPQHDEESRSVKVSVWWDFQKCNLPVGANAFKVAQSITGAIRNSGIKGPISITAFGDILHLPRSNQEALSATGISLTHVPQGGNNSADGSLITDLMCWVSQNPPPAHLFLISNDKEFASVLHRLRMSNYNILLASKPSAPGVLCSAASIMWDWDALIKGETVTGKHFNQPPDGPYNSWYGHYRVPLLDPFAIATTAEKSSTVKIEEVSESESISLDSVKVRPIPKEVVNKIRLILKVYPKGAPISELRAELIKSDLAIDKDFYGHKKFSRFLLSMPDVLRVDTASDGLFVVRAVAEKATPTKLDSSPGLSTAKVKEKETATASSPKVMTDVELAAERRVRDESLGKKQVKVTENDKRVKEKAAESLVLVKQKDFKTNDKPVETNQVDLIPGSDSSMEDGFFQKLKRLWSGPPQVESEHLPENKSASGSGDKDEVVVSDGKAEDKDKDLKSVSQILPSFAGESAEEVKAGTDEVGNNDKNETPGFFSQLLKSFKFWERRNTELSSGLSGNQKLVDADSQVHGIFAEESSWSDVESFINSPRGFVIVSHSRTREMMAKNLQREGPSCLKQLDESSMLHLVTLLISDKKWIEEKPSSSLPFTITKGSIPSHRPASNGLSSIFSDCVKPQSQKQEGEKRFKNVAHAGVSSVSYKGNAVADCQKLIKKITEKNPEGYSLIRFRKDFLEEYGYHLAIDKLGYENLQSLVQVMPGVKISSGYIFPSPGGKSRKEDESDLSFEELGPVSDAAPNQPTNKKLPVYEPSLSEDEDSESERDSPKKKKQEMNGGDKESSLLQILDAYHRGTGGEVKMEKLERKQKPSKTYSFVKDSEV
ncbi:unnamed protein product [Microthlaspi erraticum]|uniref:HTH OST-type domain-containing protein n=1 Tax=Microthlaspi erraticum TaxID=1685480 RepID=A0A6D2IFM8_9BRAS|nr:unnamed protein product [Microthlaspi erraticum]